MPKNERLTIGRALTKIEAVRAYCAEILEAYKVTRASGEEDGWNEGDRFEDFAAANFPGAPVVLELVELESRIPY